MLLLCNYLSMVCGFRGWGSVTDTASIITAWQLHYIHRTWRLHICCAWFSCCWNSEICICLIHPRFCMQLVLNNVIKKIWQSFAISCRELYRNSIKGCILHQCLKIIINVNGCQLPKWHQRPDMKEVNLWIEKGINVWFPIGISEAINKCTHTHIHTAMCTSYWTDVTPATLLHTLFHN